MTYDHPHRSRRGDSLGAPDPCGRQRGRGIHRHHPEFPGHGGPDAGRGHRPHRGGGRGRAARGDVRAAALLLLAEGPMHGYQLMQAIAERTGGAWQPSPGAVYPTINQLEDEGLVTVTAQGGRRLVTLTETGQAYVAENRATLGTPFAAFTARVAGGLDLRGPLHELRAACWQVARAGDPDQVASAHRVLTEARRALYLILAGATPGDPAGDAPAGGAPAGGSPASGGPADGAAVHETAADEKPAAQNPPTAL